MTDVIRRHRRSPDDRDARRRDRRRRGVAEQHRLPRPRQRRERLGPRGAIPRSTKAASTPIPKTTGSAPPRARRLAYLAPSGRHEVDADVVHRRRTGRRHRPWASRHGIGVHVCVKFGCLRRRATWSRRARSAHPTTRTSTTRRVPASIQNVPLDASLHQDTFELQNFVELSPDGLAEASRARPRPRGARPNHHRAEGVRLGRPSRSARREPDPAVRGVRQVVR